MAGPVEVLLTEKQVDNTHSEGNGEFIWTVPNWVSLSANIQSLTAYCQEVNLKLGSTGSSLAQVELGFYDKSGNSAPHLKIKILDTRRQSQPHLSVCLALLLGNGDESSWGQTINTPVTTDRVLEFPNVNLSVGGNESYWRNCLTSSKACAFKVKLILTYENVRDVRETQLKELQESSRKNFLNYLENLWSNPDRQDVSIICGGNTKIQAHHFVLVVRCPAMKTQFPDVFKKQTSEVHVPQIQRNAMEILLEFLYTGKLSDRWSEAGIIENFAFAVGLFGITELLHFLDQMLGENSQVENTMSLLKFTEKFNLHEAKEKILRNLVARAGMCKTSEELEALFCSSSLEDAKIEKLLP